MKLTLNARALISIGVGVSLLLPLTAQAADPGRSPTIESGDQPVLVESDRSLAAFEGRTLDLSKDWGGAQACWVHEDGNTSCYRTEAELEAAVQLEEIDQQITAMPTSLGEGFARANAYRASTCGVSAKLYKGAWYSYSVLYVSQRYTWLNMSWYGFDNSVSSYKIGTCSTTFRSGSYGGGSTYWGNTGRYSWKPYMGSWDNVLSSIFIS